jgi:hypothetical protein
MDGGESQDTSGSSMIPIMEMHLILAKKDSFTLDVSSLVYSVLLMMRMPDGLGERKRELCTKMFHHQKHLISRKFR